MARPRMDAESDIRIHRQMTLTFTDIATHARKEQARRVAVSAHPALRGGGGAAC